MSDGPPPPSEAQLAAIDAFHKFTIELWTLFSIALLATLLRTYARVRAVGFKNLKPDDYLAWVGQSLYLSLAILAYSIGQVAHGLANNGMTDEQRAALSPDDPEYRLRVIGSKIQVAGWTNYSALIWCYKASMLCFFIRLTEGLGRPYRIRVNIGFFLVITTFLASMLTIFAACQPFSNYWQISPDPGNVCQAGISKPIIWVSFASNVSTDLYLICIPLPMLWQSSLKLPKKIASTIVLGAGIFVLVCAILKSVFVLVDTVHGAQLAGTWGMRESFVAVITTNLPMIFPLFKSWLSPMFGSSYSSKAYHQTPTGFRTIGGGGGESHSRGHRAPAKSDPMTNMSFGDSEERIVDEIKLHNLRNYEASVETPAGIMVSKQVEVTHADKESQNGDKHPQPIREW
ncbi:hypothetical protein RJ55_04942 [Drechmeria coniospora]|nr:hypothetical protein RJ55_04942 [Drechmeria coniospora]